MANLTTEKNSDNTDPDTNTTVCEPGSSWSLPHVKPKVSIGTIFNDPASNRKSKWVVITPMENFDS